jgi:hypothetical protein
MFTQWAGGRSRHRPSPGWSSAWRDGKAHFSVDLAGGGWQLLLVDRPSPAGLDSLIGGWLTIRGSGRFRQYAQPAAALAALLQFPPAPALLLQIPANRCCQTILKAVARLPAQLAADPGWINRVTPVVARAISHRRAQVALGGTSGQQIIERTADRLHHLFVRELLMASHAAAHPRGLPLRASPARWRQLLGELPGAVVVAAVGDHWPPCSLNRGCVGRRGWSPRSAPLPPASRTPHRC